MNTLATLDELEKLGGISDEQARQSLDRLESLENNKPGVGQIARYGGLGAAGGVAMKGIGDAIEGTKPFSGKAGRFRNVASAAVKGAIGSGAIPFIRYHMDRHVEKKTLKAFMEQHHREREKVASLSKLFPMAARAGRAAKKILKEKNAFETSQYSSPIEGPKVARQASSSPGFRPPPPLQKQGFSQSQYGSTGGYVNFPQASGQPGFRQPSLTANPLKKESEFGEEETGKKKVGFMGQKGHAMGSARIVGQPNNTLPPGPSIANVAKPKGMHFGRAIAGATKA